MVFLRKRSPSPQPVVLQINVEKTSVIKLLENQKRQMSCDFLFMKQTSRCLPMPLRGHNIGTIINFKLYTFFTIKFTQSLATFGESKPVLWVGLSNGCMMHQIFLVHVRNMV